MSGTKRTFPNRQVWVKGEELSVSKCGPVSTRKQTSTGRLVMSQMGRLCWKSPKSKLSENQFKSHRHLKSIIDSLAIPFTTIYVAPALRDEVPRIPLQKSHQW